VSGAVSPRRAAGQQAASANAGDAGRRSGHRLWLVTALGAFAVLCIAVLSVAPQLMEPDDYAYRGSILAMTQGDFLALSTAQAHALAVQLARVGPGQIVGSPGGGPPSIAQWQWVQLPSGRWISEKDPGYPFLAAPFQWLGIIRLAPLFYGALGCLGLFLGARRWRDASAAARPSACSAPQGRRYSSPGVTTCRPSPMPR